MAVPHANGSPQEEPAQIMGSSEPESCNVKSHHMEVLVFARGPSVIINSHMGVIMNEIAILPDVAVQVAQLLVTAAMQANKYKPENEAPKQ